MDRRTADAYERSADRWIARRGPSALADGRLPAFLRRVRRGGLVADLGCGPGWYAAAIADSGGRRAVALDISSAMLAAAGTRAPSLARVRADLAALPFGRETLDGAWAMNCYTHLPRRQLALAFADLHAALRPGAPVALTLADVGALKNIRGRRREELEHRFDDDKLGSRLFTVMTRERAIALLLGAGFTEVRAGSVEDTFWIALTARRDRTLPDLVRPGLRLLICGLNPSLYSADAGIPFARPGNRFWPAALAAGLVSQPRDARAAVQRGIGFTDLVKRATPGAAELSPREYAAGAERVAALARLYRPKAICFVGLDGWRAAVDRRARPGWIPGGFAGVAAYLMPSTSGRNAATSLTMLTDHLQRAWAGSPSMSALGEKIRKQR